MTFLSTSRLLLRIPMEKDAVLIADFEERNSIHFSPWQSTTFEDEPNHFSKIAEWEKERKEGRALRFLVFKKEDSLEKVIGVCNFTQIFRQSFQACYLGYRIDRKEEGKGLMSEALREAIQYMFIQEKLHRIMANYMPSNMRSANLLKRLGFVEEGYAKSYLFINGRWEDHVLTALINLE